MYILRYSLKGRMGRKQGNNQPRLKKWTDGQIDINFILP